MDMLIFSGIQASGKSSFFKQNFADTHVRINLDMLRTRRRECILIEACLCAKQALVIDNTNLTVIERAVYIAAAREARFRVLGYRFFVDLEMALQRNASRTKPVPERALLAARRRWELPQMHEGFDAIFDIHEGGVALPPTEN